MKRVDVLVVGAGLAGLTAARYLQQAGIDVVVVEATDRPGGRVKSDYISGFILDHGFQVINPGYSEIKASRALKDLDFNPLGSGFAVVENGIKVSPWNAPFMGSVGEKVRFAKFIASRGTPSESFGEVSKDFPELYANLLKPFLQGVFLANPDKEDALVAKTIIRSFATGRPGVPRSGVQAFSSALARDINEISFGERVEVIRGTQVVTTREHYSARFVIVATESAQSSQLLGLPEVPMAKSTTWYHAIDGSISRDGTLRAFSEGSIANTIAISDCVSSYAPSGKKLLSTTVLGKASEKKVVAELARLWSITPAEITSIARHEIPRALPIHAVGRELLLNPWVSDSVLVAGDYRAWPSQQGAMTSGRRAAEEIIRRARSKH